MKEKSFGQSIGGLKGAKIGFYLNCNQFVKGTLLEVKQDHLVVDVNDIVHYFSLHQIHALSKNATDIRISSQKLPYLDRDHLTDVLKDLKYSWVTINSLSNQLFVGLLSKIADDHIILIRNGEQLYIQNSFISNIYKGNYKIEEVAQIPPIQSKDETSVSTIEEVQEYALEDEAIVQSLSKKTDVDNFQMDNPQSSTKVDFIDEPKSIFPNKHFLLKLDSALSIDLDQPPLLHSEVDSSFDLDQLPLLHSEVDSSFDLDQTPLLQSEGDSSFDLDQLPLLHSEVNSSFDLDQTPLLQSEGDSSFDLDQTPLLQSEGDSSFDLGQTPLLQSEGDSSIVLDQTPLLQSEGDSSFDLNQTPLLQSEVNSSFDLDQTPLLYSDDEGSNQKVLQTNKKRVPITFNTIFSNQHSKETEHIPLNEEKSISNELPSIKSDLENLVEKLDSANEKLTQLTSKKINSKEEKIILEKQYFALMKYARKIANNENLDGTIFKLSSGNTKLAHSLIRQLSLKEEKIMLKKQYFALMKHAEKMYRQLRDERLRH
ncbi:hypothetical protein ABE042_20375 [Viridibacillus arvi]|uniref:hypothetical protein n=1 Tax=Viridibacillus arvi TaxID=263475 RepID=UPI003D29337D